MAINPEARLDLPPERRLFLAVQGGKAVLGLAAALAFTLVVGRTNAAETVAIIGLLAPLVLTGLGLTSMSVAALEQAGLAIFALLIGYLALLTGGVASPLVIWLALVPAEAALTGDRHAILRAGIAAGAVLLLVAGAQAFGILPPASMGLPVWLVQGASALAALTQAVAIAAAAQERQREADRAAADGAALYRFLADNATDMITRHGADGRIRFASPAVRLLLGREAREIEGQAPSSFVHPDDVKLLQAALVESSHFDRPGAAELRLKHRDGHYVWAEMRCRPARAHIGDAAEIVAVTRDISERKAQAQALMEARDQAMEASRAKSRFLANMSHELRTPLNAIIGFSEVMDRQMFGPAGNARYQEYAHLIHESGTHLLDLINGVLDMAKIEAGKFELHEEVFALADVAQAAAQFVRMAAEKGGVTVSVQIGPGARSIYADQRAIKQMLINLLTNGIKYTPAGGTVRIMAGLDGKVVTIAVADTGAGIAKADLERLGRPFEQVDGEHTRAKEGTGLGLALVKSLAALHGGEARIQSAVGHGTVVTLTLPHAAVDAAGARVESSVIPFRAVS